MTAPLDPVRGPRVEPAAPARRVERSPRDQEREQGGGRQQPHDEPDERRDDEEDTGLHVDVLA
jgi:hypothetical protein